MNYIKLDENQNVLFTTNRHEEGLIAVSDEFSLYTHTYQNGNEILKTPLNISFDVEGDVITFYNTHAAASVSINNPNNDGYFYELTEEMYLEIQLQEPGVYSFLFLSKNPLYKEVSIEYAY
jgi:hypothetical protein